MVFLSNFTETILFELKKRNIVAAAIGKDPAFVARTIRLTLLAPEIIHEILAGTLRKSIPMDILRQEMPVRWEDQKKLFCANAQNDYP